MALTEKLIAIADAIRVQSGKTDGLTLAQMPGEIIGLQLLNFEIAGNPQPVQPKENTIWVDTDAEITSWMFSVEKPKEPAEGMVWFLTGAFSSVPFNGLKKNGIMVYPLSAKQYIGGEWVNKTATSYQNGKWEEWIPAGALYYNGNQCVETSGGWKARGWKYSEDYNGTVVPNITFNDDHMEITVPNANTSGGAVEVINDQDLTNANSLSIDFEVPEIAYYEIGLIAIKRNASSMGKAVKSVELANGNDTQLLRKTVELDVSDISGTYDIAIRFSDHWGGVSKATMKVYSVLKNAAPTSPGGGITSTHDGEGNVFISGIAAVDDGS